MNWACKSFNSQYVSFAWIRYILQRIRFPSFRMDAIFFRHTWQIREASVPLWRPKFSGVDHLNFSRTISAIMKNDRSDESTAITGLRSTRRNGWDRAICLHVETTEEEEFVDELFSTLLDYNIRSSLWRY